MRCVIFDLDGTLADTSGDLLAAANACFREMGHGDVLEHARDAGVALRGGRAMLTHGLERVGAMDVAVVDAWYKPLLEAYAGAIDVHSVMYPGAVDAIEALRRDGYAVGVCTNKPEALAQQLLVSLGVRDLFGSLIGADTLPVRKPDPLPYVASVEQAGGAVGSSCLVGDTATDRNTARAAGVPSILVTFGPGGAEMAALGPEAMIGHFDELGDVVRRLVG